MTSFKNKPFAYTTILSFSLITLFLNGCGQKKSATASSEVVPSPTPESVSVQETVVQQNLNNGVVPHPKDVKNGTVAEVLDACAKFRKSLPADFIQDLIEVPEDPSKPDGIKIHVFYYGKIKAGTTPVVFFNGGPGSDSHSSYRTFTQNAWMLDSKNEVSMIYIDQRGNGCSDPYPQVADRKHPDQATLQRLRFYGSSGIVADAEIIRKKLIQDQTWISFGHSYGSFISHRYATNAPSSLKASFAHANTINSDGYTRIKNRILSQTRVLDLYLKQYPDDEKALETLNTQFSAKTCYPDPDSKDEACGAEILSEIPSSLLGFNDAWPEIHEWINLMVQDGKVRDEGVTLFLKTFYFGSSNPLNNKHWAFKVIDWTDRGEPSYDGYHCKKIKEDLFKDHSIDLDKSWLNECMIQLQYVKDHPDEKFTDPSLNSVTKDIPRDLLTVDAFVSALKSNPTLQFHWYSGTKDAYVPIENYSEELNATKDLTNVHYKNFTGTGHDGYFTEPAVWIDLIQEIKR